MTVQVLADPIFLLLACLAGLPVLLVVYRARQRPEAMRSRLDQFKDSTGINLTPKSCALIWVLSYILFLMFLLVYFLLRSQTTKLHWSSDAPSSAQQISWLHLLFLCFFIILVCPWPMAIIGRKLAKLLFARRDPASVHSIRKTYIGAISFLVCFSVVVPIGLWLFSGNSQWCFYVLLIPTITLCTLGSLIWGLLTSSTLADTQQRHNPE
jgi:hypothetical protein